MHEPRLRSRGTFQPDLTLDSKSEAYNHLQSPPETPVREGIAELNQSIMLPPVDQGFGAWSFVRSLYTPSVPAMTEPSFDRSCPHFSSRFYFGDFRCPTEHFLKVIPLQPPPSSQADSFSAYMSDEVYSSQPHADVLLPLIGQLSTGLMFCSGALAFAASPCHLRERSVLPRPTDIPTH